VDSLNIWSDVDAKEIERCHFKAFKRSLRVNMSVIGQIRHTGDWPFHSSTTTSKNKKKMHAGQDRDNWRDE
jgi:hypothetical protein